MSYNGKMCLAIIQVPQPTEMHCVHMIVSGESQREHKFNTGALLQHSKVINPPAKKFRLGSNQSE